MRPQRKYVTTACDTCRESKIKCDGVRPACSNCQHKMRACHYQGIDKRKVSLKSIVDLLISRLDELSQFIVDQGFPLPPMFDENDSALKNSLETLGLRHVKIALEEIERKQSGSIYSTDLNINHSADVSHNVTTDNFDAAPIDHGIDLLVEPFTILEDDTPLQTHSEPSILEQVSLEGPAEPLIDETAQEAFEHVIRNDNQPVLSAGDVEPTSAERKEPTTFQPTPSKQDGDIKHLAEDVSGKEGMEDIVNQLSDRMGNLQVGSDGQVRYYGPTSHFNLLRMPTPDGLTIHRTVRKDGRDYLNRMGIDKEVPRDLEDHLLNLCFTWHSPTVDVVHRGMYETAKQQWMEKIEETPYYSEALTNAMCCLGSAFEPRYHPNFITYPKSVSDFFADRAKTLLDIELDSPTVATVQAMVVLSGHDIGCKRDARGWLYSGMAMRLAFDLGLHLDVSSHVADGTISQAEADLRAVVFWGAYTLDHHWGFLLGRPFRINLEDVTVPKPASDLSRDQAQRWYPYGLPYTTSFPLGRSVINPTALLSQYRISLCEIMTPLGHVLYGSVKISREALQRLNEETTYKLLAWKDGLPEALKVDLDDETTAYLPHSLLLHLHYHQAIIHAHRPWMSESSIQPQPQQGPGHFHARKMCVESATSIAKLLSIYEKYYTFRRMNIQAVAITCSAALILIFAKILSNDHHDDQETAGYLNICFRGLEEFGSSWESAKRAQNFLLHMQGLLESRVRPYRSGKRHFPASQGFTPLESPYLKRPRTLITPPAYEGGNTRVNSAVEEFDWLWATTMGSTPEK